MADSPQNRVTASVELGPKARALLRRILMALEVLVGQEIPDPGQDTEVDTEDE